MTLELKAVSKRLGSFQLPPLTLSVAEGDYFVLLGPSGVGKTVLLEIIAGLMKPDSGQIIWRGKDITTSPPENRGFAIVYQDYALFPHLSVRQNIAYGLRGKRLGANEVHARVEEIAAKTKIETLLDRCPSTLSGGEQQRVSLARALVVEPQILLLDEPLSAVDLQIRRTLRKELKSLQRSMDTTFIHITHDVDEALQLGQSIGVMLDGAIQQVGTPEELFQRPSDAAVSEFLGIANVLPVASLKSETCIVHGHSIHLGLHNGNVRYIWIRPEEILVSNHTFESSARNQIHCKVSGWEFHDVLVAVQVSSGSLELKAMITYTSFIEMGISVGDELYATFKSSSIFSF